jgi:hypothetical protein
VPPAAWADLVRPQASETGDLARQVVGPEVQVGKHLADRLVEGLLTVASVRP